MRACTTASGGVMFIEDEIEHQTKSMSYKDLLKEKSGDAKPKAFGKRKTANTDLQEAA